MNQFFNIIQIMRQVHSILWDYLQTPFRQSKEEATEYGVYAMLRDILADQAHIIDPSQIQLSASTEQQKWIVKFADELRQIIQGDGFSLEKPIIAIWTNYHHSIPHWQTCVIIPKGYKCYSGLQIKNEYQRLFFLDSFQSINIPQKLEEKLKNLRRIGNQTQQIGKLLPNLQVFNCYQKDYSSKDGMQIIGGFTSVYNAIMLIFEGSNSFLNEKKYRIGSQLLQVFPELTFQKRQRNPTMTYTPQPNNFIQMVQKDYFIDKTLLIKQVMNHCRNHFIFLRPRRWGKSLNLNMIKSYIQIQHSDEIKKKKDEAFEKTRIAQEIQIKHKHYGKWPVIYLNFGAGAQYSYEALLAQIRFQIKQAFRQHRYLLQQFMSKIWSNKNDELARMQKQQFCRYMEGNYPNEQIDISLKCLSRLLYEKYQRKVFILVDKYDSPFNRPNLQRYYNGDYKKVMDRLRRFYEHTTKINQYCSKAIMTGILPIGPIDPCSGLNHFIEYGVLDYDFSRYFGFCQSEVAQLFQSNALLSKKYKDIKSQIKSWYNGYNIGYYKIYNPWSIMRCFEALQRNQPNPVRQYWSLTGNTQLLQSLYRNIKASDSLDQLIRSGSFKKNLSYKGYQFKKDSEENFLVFLLYFGYLTQGKQENQYKIPNQQINKHFFKDMMKAWLQKTLLSNNRPQLLKLFTQSYQDYEKYQRFLNQDLLPKISSHSNNEAFFKTLIGGMIKLAQLQQIENANHKMLVQQHNKGNKRLDLILIPIEGKSETVIIQEFKVCSNNKKEYFQEEALYQLYVNNYLSYPVSGQRLQWSWFKLRTVVFYQSNGEGPWKAQIKEHQHNVQQAKRLVQIFASTEKLTDKKNPHKKDQKLQKETLLDILKQSNKETLEELVKAHSLQQIQLNQDPSNAISPFKKEEMGSFSRKKRDQMPFSSKNKLEQNMEVIREFQRNQIIASRRAKQLQYEELRKLSQQDSNNKSQQ